MNIIGGPYCGGYISTELSSFEEGVGKVIVHPALSVKLLNELYQYDSKTGTYRFREYSWENA